LNVRRDSKFAGLAGIRQLGRRMSEALRLNGAIPFFRPHLGVNGATIDLGEGPIINYSGYNYLGLSGHPEVSAAAKAAIDRYGTSAGASRIVAGEIPLHRELETELADFLGAEDCLAFVSGYNTNVTTIGHLYGRRDLLLHDAQAHNSLIKGCLQSHARRIDFAHNDIAAVDHNLAVHRAAYKRVLVIVEGAYSMAGDAPDLAQLADVCLRHQADLLVDEAHSIGTLGATGRGLVEHQGLKVNPIDVHTGTLSKALASCGGFVAGDATLIEYLRYSAPGFIFSVGLPPADTAAALAALRILRREPGRVLQLQARAAEFRRAAFAAGLEVSLNDPTPIVPVRIGDQHRCMQISMQLLGEGINVQPVVYPAVAANEAMLRFFLTSEHTSEQIRFTIERLGLAVGDSRRAAAGE
jgi:8-amino-7-oxononanoate synthase